MSLGDVRYLRIPSVPESDQEGRLRVELTRSANRRRTTVVLRTPAIQTGYQAFDFDRQLALPGPQGQKFARERAADPLKKRSEKFPKILSDPDGKVHAPLF